jgi:hypothetical protein
MGNPLGTFLGTSRGFFQSQSLPFSAYLRQSAIICVICVQAVEFKRELLKRLARIRERRAMSRQVRGEPADERHER